MHVNRIQYAPLIIILRKTYISTEVYGRKLTDFIFFKNGSYMCVYGITVKEQFMVLMVMSSNPS